MHTAQLKEKCRPTYVYFYCISTICVFQYTETNHQDTISLRRSVINQLFSEVWSRQPMVLTFFTMFGPGVWINLSEIWQK